MSTLERPAGRSNSFPAEYIPTRPTSSTSSDSSFASNGLLYTALHQLAVTPGQGAIVVVTSANSGEGVTYSIGTLINTIQRDKNVRVLRLDARRLGEIICPPHELPDCCQQVEPNVYEFVGGPGRPVERAASWKGNWEYRANCMNQLRNAFDFVFIDAPALNSSGDALSLAPLVDGLILVVEADKTRIDQIQHAEKSIEFTRGKLVGHILNKRTFAIPSWIYKRL